MRIPQRTTAWLLFLFLATPGLTSAQHKARLVGRILDPDGKPIAGVSVVATSPQLPNFKQTLTTDRRGTFLIDFDDIDVTYHYRFDKAGYDALEVNQEWHFEGTQRFDWRMIPGSPVTVNRADAVPVTTSQPAVTAFNAGVTALNAKDYATAEAKLKEAVQADPKLARGWAALSAAQVQNGHNQDAVESADNAVALGLKDGAVLTARWQAYRNLKDDAKAAEALTDLESVGRATEEAKKIHNEGVALAKTGDNAGALTKFQEALRVDPNLQPALLGLATSALATGQDDAAATAAETVLQTDPGNAQALRLRYNACLKLNDKPRLFDALVGLAAVEPAIAAKGLLALAVDAYEANDRPVATNRFLKLLALEPDQPLVHYYLAMLYVAEGNYEQTRVHLGRLIALAPKSPEAATAREMLKQLPKL